jgi:hypothetical protein
MFKLRDDDAWLSALLGFSFVETTLEHIGPQELRGRRTIPLRQRREADRQQMSAAAFLPRGLMLILQHARPSLAPHFLAPSRAGPTTISIEA